MKKKRILLVGAVVIVAAGGLAAGVWKFGRPKRAVPEEIAQVETVQIKRQNLVKSISVTGTVKSADEREVSASAREVKVLEVNCKVGDQVEAGDVMVVLDSSDLTLKLQEAQNKQALSAYNENKSIETATENYTDAVEDGTDEYNRAVKSEARAKEALQEAVGNLSSAAERLKRREERLAEAQEALTAAAEPVVPSDGAEDPACQDAWEAYQELKAACEEAQTAYTEAHREYITAEEAEKAASETYETASEALAEAERKNDRTVSSAEAELEKAEMEHTYSNDSSQQTIESYQEQIESCTVRAPISGVITAVHVDPGDTYMGEGSVLFSVADQEHFEIAASVDEYDISSIQKDMTAAVLVEALGSEELPAKVSFVSPTAASQDTGNASYDIRIALDDIHTDLRAGMTAKASIVQDAVYDVLTVPYDCVETDAEGNASVWIDQGGEKVSVPVETGMEGDYYVEVSGDGLTEETLVYYPMPMLGADSNREGAEQVTMIPGTRGGPEGMEGAGGGRPEGRPGGF